VHLDGYPDVLLSLRLQDGRKLVHLINTTGRERYLEEFNPVGGLRLGVRCVQRPDRVRMAGSGQDLDFDYADGIAWTAVPELVDYDIVVFEN
jgi:hypothetical protein